MNKIYAGNSWHKRKAQAAEIHELVRYAILNQVKPTRTFQKPVRIYISYNSRLDIDNHGYLSKLIIDGMKHLLIDEDSRKYVKELTQSFHEKAQNLVFVVVTDE